jgi:hypothetical protein
VKLEVTAWELGTAAWFDSVNAHLAQRDPRGPTEPLLADISDVADLESALERGGRSDPRCLAVNIAITGECATDSLYVVFSAGLFAVHPGLVRHCDAVARMDAGTARDAFRNGTDTHLVNAVMEGRAEAAGSWDAISFVRVHLVPEADLDLRAVTA